MKKVNSSQLTVHSYNGVIERYKEYLPITDETPIVSLKEGNTPLIKSLCLTNALPKGFEVYLKYEGLNPTGSFKDRGMTLAVSKAKEEGSSVVICASTGNTSASAAAYAARARISCVVLIPQGAIALGKLSQALIHGAKVLSVKGNFDDALKLVREIADKYPITLVNSLNPYRIEGQKTAAFEICDSLGDSPDYQVMPVGNAGNITAYWKGYKEYRMLGKVSQLPRMLGFQAKGAAPIVLGRPVKNPKTIATAIRIGNPASWQHALKARDESSGLIDSVTDKEILDAYKLLAKEEGVFVEPASAASIAGLIKLIKQGYFKKSQANLRLNSGLPSVAGHKSQVKRIVCILTGHGLKDPDRAVKSVKSPKVVQADLKAILKELGY